MKDSPESHESDGGDNAQADRILDMALKVFGESSYADATTGEIARRSQVSKRDLYAHFPQKEVLLFSVITRYLREQDHLFRSILQRGRAEGHLRTCLETIGTALTQEALSPGTQVIARLVASEQIQQPLLAGLMFEGRLTFRTQELALLLQGFGLGEAMDLCRLAERYLALITFLPLQAASAGMVQQWDSSAIRQHVEDSVACVLCGLDVGDERK